MAESAKQHSSIGLYRYMCEFIIGSEEHVKTIRMMNTVRDNLSFDNISSAITSGSFGEGLDMRGSDLDFMFILKYYEVLENKHIPFDLHTTYFVMDTDETLPGFTQLRLLHNSRFDTFEFVKIKGRDLYFSSASFKYVLSCPGLDYVHGPCMSDKGGIFDIASSLHCKSWIKPAMQWVTRSNNGWPDKNVKHTIVKHGVLFVPIGVKGSTNEDLEWRMSFSVGEKFLIASFTHTQLLCYALMKIILKDIIRFNVNCDDLLCSYFIKTIMLWISEEILPSIWKPENLITCFMRCFRRLLYYVEYLVCPHYFIPENDLFEKKINRQSQTVLFRELLILNSYDWKFILFSQRFFKSQKLSLYRLTEHRDLNVARVKNFLISHIYVADSFLTICEFKVDKTIHMVKSIMALHSSKIKQLYLFYMSKFRYRTVQLPLFNAACVHTNKSSYVQYKICTRTLLMNLGNDALSGWLLLASSFFNTKLYNSAIYILQYCLSKCTPDKIEAFGELSNTHKRLLNLNLIRKMSIVQLWKNLLINEVLFLKKSTLIPDVLKLEVETTDFYIPAVVYIHFLRFLCHFRLNNTMECDSSIRDIHLTIEKSFFIVDSTNKYTSFNVLGIACQMKGDLESAKQAYWQSMRLQPDHERNSAFRRVALIC